MSIRDIQIHWHNWKHRKTGRAYRTLVEAMQDDPAYAHTWLCNIAMPIYDATRPSCVCKHIQPVIGSEPIEHIPECAVHMANTIPRRFECREMSIEQANYIAEKIMRQLFQVDVAQNKFPRCEEVESP